MISKAPYSARKSVQRTVLTANLNHLHPVSCSPIVHFCCMVFYVPLPLTLPCACSPFSPPLFLLSCVSITAVDLAKGGFKWSLPASL